MSAVTQLASAALQLAGDHSAIADILPISGGSISRALRLRSERGTYVLKTSARQLPDFFAAEARGLELLRATGAVRVPQVLAFRDTDNAAEGFMLLEWIQAPAESSRQRAAAALGEQLAALHRHSAPAYGLDHDNYIGATPQPNGHMTSWLAFFRERRLGFQIELAGSNGLLSGTRARLLDRLLGQLDRWIDDRLVKPALLHGDLWGGNFIVGPGGAPALIDPAAYYGDREADLALTALFGGFPASFYQAYQAAWPLADGWQVRRDLYNLYHLLNHLNLFGESYGAQVDEVLRLYMGEID